MRPFERVLSALTAALALTLAAQETVFRVDVRLVRILATVKNAAGDLAGSLPKEAFTILDNGVEQTISVFEKQTGQPLSVALLMDTSASTGKDLKYEVESASHFLKALFGAGNSKDTAALYSFNYEVVRRNYFTHNHGPLDQSLRALKSEAGTSLYDAIFLAAEDLQNRDGRHVIVAVTDGGDTTSVKDFHAALDAAQLANAVIYPILVVPITNAAGRNVGGENALTTLARGTGGRVFTPSAGSALDAAFAEILRDLRTQYLLGYYTANLPPSKNRFHKLEVRVDRPDLRVSARNGYYESSTPREK